jgi:serine protease Do
MQKATVFLLVLLLAVLGGGAALAQTDASDAASDSEGTPAAFLTMSLQAGFPLDPFVVSLNGGGEVDATTLDPACVGFISEAPTFSVDWQGAVEFFDIFYYSDFDPTLVLQLPDGSYLCNDDAGDNLLDPELSIESPADGQYNLWVGSFDEGQIIPGFLVITANRSVSVNNFDPGALVQRTAIADDVQPANVVGADAVQATLGGEADEVAAVAASRAAGQEIVPDVEIAGGDTPITTTVVAEGETPVFTILNEDDNGVACGGLVSGAAPEFVFNYSGDSADLRIFFEGSADSSLIVVGEEIVLCSDDSQAGENGNPLIDIVNPSGLYGVWVGRFDATEPVTGTLTVVEATDVAPALIMPMQLDAEATETP